MTKDELYEAIDDVCSCLDNDELELNSGVYASIKRLNHCRIMMIADGDAQMLTNEEFMNIADMNAGGHSAFAIPYGKAVEQEVLSRIP